MQTTEVTQGQWKKVMGGKNPSHFSNCGDDCPVESITWDDIQGFIEGLNKTEGGGKYRLPTEAEWEYACRAGSPKAYSFGNDTGELGKYAWYNNNSHDTIHPVYKLNPNAWGLYDMHGNVWEWCSDWYGNDYYQNSPKDNPPGPESGSDRVVRGGWLNNARGLRASDCYLNTPAGRYNLLGFRLARTP